MVEILAHRCNINGQDFSRENRAKACKECLNLGFGLELDVRNYKGNLYAKHDPVISDKEQAWAKIIEIIDDYPQLPIAINIKDTGHENYLVETISKLNKFKVFLFDLELVVGIEKYELLSSIYKSLDSTIEIAIRVSDRGETLERAIASKSTVVWLDEFDSFWVSQEVVQKLSIAGKRVYAVAPDLHKHSAKISITRCQEFVAWNVAGICTDYPIMLRDFLKGIK
ncbi:hypothetical protein [Dolichospermum circinale]|uniref:hypothetical protein n=1 Tax=Dolichospermum circinale TaxID=109265 RepID=UPI0023312473|nr:hypothetical protein [Dolichospermum circinale]MDB9467313.1 hypothetical protein [Dolichospermum circinale CS-539/09]MDB9470557.1 hypothetical protein [Dolichospermum circinale CS-539]